jgi:hypothetical protein
MWLQSGGAAKEREGMAVRRNKKTRWRLIQGLNHTHHYTAKAV